MLPSHAQSVEEILKQSLDSYLTVLKKILPIVLLMVIVKDIDIYLGVKFLGNAAQIVVDVIQALLLVYLFSVSLYVTRAVLSGETITLSDAFSAVFKLIWKVYLICLIFVVVYFIFSYGIYLVHAEVLKLMLGLLFLGLIVQYFFIIPRVILDNDTVFSAFKKSAKDFTIIGWLIKFALYAFLLIVFFIVSTNTKHGHWLMNYYLNLPVDFIVILLALPLFNSFMVLFLNDAKLNKKLN